MENEYFYNTEIKWEESRTGTLKADTLPDIKVATPPEFPKGVPNTWSPEHLFVASANVCLMTTFTAVAENSKLEFQSYIATANGKMERVDGKFMFTEIEIVPEITVTREKDIERAERIIKKAEDLCLISNSMKTKISLMPKITIEKK